MSILNLRFSMAMVIFISLMTLTNEDAITCPSLICTVSLDSGVCYLHDMEQPTLIVRGQSCGDDANCELSITSGEFAWFSEETQSVSSGATSFIQQKRIQAKCINTDNQNQGLYGGRKCDSGINCYSFNCEDGVCVGLEEGDYCNNDADCDANLFCKQETVWPFRARCNELLGNMERCSEDTECGTQYFCWYATEEDKQNSIKRCLEMYSQDDDKIIGWDTSPNLVYTDSEYNGLFCKSGIAVASGADAGACKAITSITFNGATLASPYECDPSDNSIKCNLVYGTGGTDYVEVPCKCALDGTTGYCGSIAGTDEYKLYTDAIRVVYNSSECHTLDRENLRAQRESCGIGTSTDQWRYGVEKRFNMTYWPYIQKTATRNCANAIFHDSITNLSS